MLKTVLQIPIAAEEKESNFVAIIYPKEDLIFLKRIRNAEICSLVPPQKICRRNNSPMKYTRKADLSIIFGSATKKICQQTL